MLGSPLARPVAATLALLVVYGGYQLWLRQVGVRVLAPEVAAGPPEQRLALQITLAVEPEQFHMSRLQGLGRLIEMRAQSAYVVDVERREAQAFARNYWVARIEPWQRP